MRCYVLARGISPSEQQSVVVRHEAQLLWETPAVQTLRDRLEYRGKRQVEERLFMRTGALLDRAHDEAAQANLTTTDDKEVVRMNPLAEFAATQSISLIRAVGRERSIEYDQRKSKAYRTAQEAGRERLTGECRCPARTSFDPSCR